MYVVLVMLKIQYLFPIKGQGSFAHLVAK